MRAAWGAEVSLSEQPRAKAESSSPSWVVPSLRRCSSGPPQSQQVHHTFPCGLPQELSLHPEFHRKPLQAPTAILQFLLTSLLPFLHTHLPKPSHSKPAAALTRDTKPALSHIYCSWQEIILAKYYNSI